MRSWLTDTLHVGLSPNGIAVMRSSGWLRSSQSAIADDPIDVDADFTTATSHLRTVLTETNCANSALNLVVADRWVRLFMVTPPRNATSPQDLHAAAGMRFQALFGDQLSDWHIDADWNALHPFLACAMPRTLLDPVQKLADECKVTITAIVPHFVAACNRWRTQLKPGDWLGVLHDNGFTVGIIDQQGLHAVRSSTAAANAHDDLNWLPEYVAREALRLNLDMPNRIQLCGQLSTQRPAMLGKLHCAYLGTPMAKHGDKAASSAALLAFAGMGQ